MFFKNLHVYSITDDLKLGDIEDQLARLKSEPIGQMQETRFGFVPSFKNSVCYAELISGALFVTAEIQQRILPNYVINDELVKRLEVIENNEGRKPGVKEREHMKEDIRAEFLPKAFIRVKRVRSYIDQANKVIVVDAASESMADDFNAYLREAIGSLPIVPWLSKAPGYDLLTAWYIDPSQRPSGMSIESDLRLSMVQDPAVKAAYKNLDVDAPEINQSLESGMRIRQMAVDFDEICSFSINEKFAIKRIKYAESLSEQAQDSDDPRTDAMIMKDTISNVIKAIEKVAETESI